MVVLVMIAIGWERGKAAGGPARRLEIGPTWLEIEFGDQGGFVFGGVPVRGYRMPCLALRRRLRRFGC